MGGLLPSTHPHICLEKRKILYYRHQCWNISLMFRHDLFFCQGWNIWFWAVIFCNFFWNSIMYSKKKWKRKKEWAVLLSYYDSKVFFYFPTRCLSWTLYAWGRLGSGWFKVLGECSTCAMFNNVQQCLMCAMFNMRNVQQCSIMCNVQQCSTIINNV